MRRTILKMTLTLCAASFVTGCLPGALTSDALFKDVSRRPPDARPETVDALVADPAFGAWVVYQDRACDRWGCVQ